MSTTTKPHHPLAGETPHTDFAKSMSYGDYLQLESLLGSQKPVSDAHDEMLFVVIHQASELWMKLAIHELSAAMQHIRQDELPPAFKMLARVSRIQEQLQNSWTVLSTMTPSDYMTFRDALGQASGFQSYQYRSIEFALGNKNAKMVAPHRHDDVICARLTHLLESPSIYDEVVRLLARRGFDIHPSQIERDWSEKRTTEASVLKAWQDIYADPKKHWDLYELGEELVDLEDSFQTWRFRHLTTVARIIGMKTGTGGTSGVSYLKRALDHRFFPELWDVRTEL